MRKEVVLATSLSIALSSASVVNGSSEQDYNEDNKFRAAVMGPGRLTVCYSKERPIEVEGLKKKDLYPHKIIIYDADCTSFDGEEVLEENDVMVELHNEYGAEIIDLNEYRNNNLGVPDVFEPIDDDSVFLPSPFVEEEENITSTTGMA